MIVLQHNTSNLQHSTSCTSCTSCTSAALPLPVRGPTAIPRLISASPHRHVRRSCHLRRHRVTATASAGPSTQSAVTPASSSAEPLRVELPTKFVRAGVRFAYVPRGKGGMVVVAEVAAPLAEAGITPGQQLLGISDPIRADEVWPLQASVSLRYIRECVRMRSAATLTLLLSPEPAPEWQQLAAASAASAASAVPAEAASDAASSSASFDDGGDGGSSMSLLDVLTSQDEDQQQGAEQLAGAASLADRVDELSREEERQVSAFQRRVKRRKDYMEQVSQRNDSGFFLGVFALFVMPAFIVLGLAWSTGYLDRLASGGF